MKERVVDGKLIIISVTVSGINDHIRFYSQMLCTTAINTSNTIRTQTVTSLSSPGSVINIPQPPSSEFSLSKNW